MAMNLHWNFQWGFSNLSENSSKSKTYSTTGKPVLKLVKLLNFRISKFYKEIYVGG
jgi:hypothetical protein